MRSPRTRGRDESRTCAPPGSRARQRPPLACRGDRLRGSDPHLPPAGLPGRGGGQRRQPVPSPGRGGGGVRRTGHLGPRRARSRPGSGGRATSRRRVGGPQHRDRRHHRRVGVLPRRRRPLASRPAGAAPPTTWRCARVRGGDGLVVDVRLRSAGRRRAGGERPGRLPAGGRHPEGETKTDMSYLDINGRSFELLLERNRGNISGATVHRDTLVRAGGFPVGYTCGADWVMFINVARYTEWHFLDARLSFVRIHPGNNTRANPTNGLMTVRALDGSLGRPVPTGSPPSRPGRLRPGLPLDDPERGLGLDPASRRPHCLRDAQSGLSVVAPGPRQGVRPDAAPDYLAGGAPGPAGPDLSRPDPGASSATPAVVRPRRPGRPGPDRRRRTGPARARSTGARRARRPSPNSSTWSMPGTTVSSNRPVRRSRRSPRRRQNSTSRSGRASASPQMRSTSSPTRTAEAGTAIGACHTANCR